MLSHCICVKISWMGQKDKETTYQPSASCMPTPHRCTRASAKVVCTGKPLFEQQPWWKWNNSRLLHNCPRIELTQSDTQTWSRPSSPCYLGPWPPPPQSPPPARPPPRPRIQSTVCAWQWLFGWARTDDTPWIKHLAMCMQRATSRGANTGMSSFKTWTQEQCTVYLPCIFCYDNIFSAKGTVDRYYQKLCDWNLLSLQEQLLTSNYYL